MPKVIVYDDDNNILFDHSGDFAVVNMGDYCGAFGGISEMQSYISCIQILDMFLRANNQMAIINHTEQADFLSFITDIAFLYYNSEQNCTEIENKMSSSDKATIVDFVELKKQMKETEEKL